MVLPLTDLSMESILKIGKNKSKCQHFTPSQIVESMLDLADYRDNLYGATVLENSFGSGNIIFGIVKRYIEYCLSKQYEKSAIAKGLSNDICGVELDADLYKKCIERLNELIASYGLPKVKWKLYNVNALSYNYNRKFDYIIGNPPYISYKEIDNDNREFIKKKFLTCQIGKPDYCYAFIELGINLLTSKGKLVQLIPNNVYKNVFAEHLRDLLKPHISCIRDYPNQKIFAKALTSISVFLYDCSDEKDYFEYENITEGIKRNIARDSLSKKWSFTDEKTTAKEYIRFGDVFNASVTVATLCNKAFVMNADAARDEKIETAILRDTVSPKTIRYKKSKKIIFPYYYENGVLKKYNDFEQRFPKACQHLQKYYADLSNRDSDKNAKWYEYGRSQALAHLYKEKLLISTIITNRVEIYTVAADSIPYSGIYITVKDNGYKLEDAVKILKSDDFLKYIKRIGISISGESLRITCNDINNYQF